MLLNRAKLLELSGDCESAVDVFNEALRIRSLHLEEHHWRIAEVKALFGGCLTALGRFDKAEQMLLNCYPPLAKARGERHRATQDAIQRIVDLYAAWEKPREASVYRAKLHEKQRRGAAASQTSRNGSEEKRTAEVKP